MPPRKKLTPEGVLLAAVIERCTAYPDVHVIRLDPAHRAQRGADNNGFPDLMIVGPGGLLFRELKTGKYCDLRPSQTVWKYRLQAARQDWAIWTTADLNAGHVDDELAALAETAAADTNADTNAGYDADEFARVTNAAFARAMARD